MKRRWLAFALSTALATASFTTGAAADPVAKRSVPRVTVISVLPETDQALVWDAIRGEYVVVRAGDQLQGRTVQAVEVDGVVLLEGSREIVLPFDADLARRRDGKAAADAIPSVTAPASSADGPVDPYAPGVEDSAVVDPYADPARNEPAIADPYADVDLFRESEVTSVQAPAHLRAGGETITPIASVPASPIVIAPTAPTAPTAPATGGGSRITEVPTAIVQPQSTPSRREEAHTVRRAELDAALSDFSALAADVSASFDAKGVRLARVAPTSLAYRLGLRDGDRITRVDGTAIRTVDDAANVYVRLLDARGFSVEVERGADLVTLRYAIQ